MTCFSNYSANLVSALALVKNDQVSRFEFELISLWDRHGKLFICGNGGSAGNAIHLANDFIFGAGYPHRPGIDVEALTANPAVLTCLANDIGYSDVFSYQLSSKAKKGDILLVLSGSGNSQNIVEALIVAKKLGLTSYSFLGFSGGKAKVLSDHSIHINCDDMQVCEDVQLIIGHHLVQSLNAYAQQSNTVHPSLSLDPVENSNTP